jgi:hypothetical protein
MADESVNSSEDIRLRLLSQSEELARKAREREEVSRALREQTAALHDRASGQAKAMWVAATVFQQARVFLGISAALLAAASGTAVLTDLNKWVPAALGFAATAVGTIQTFLPTEKWAVKRKTLSIEFERLSEKANDLCTLEIGESVDVQRMRLEDLREEYRSLRRRALSDHDEEPRPERVTAG